MSDINRLNEALAGEYFGIAAYDAAISSGLLDEGTAAVGAAFRGQHRDHAARISELVIERDATPVQPLTPEEYATKYPPLNSAEDVLAYAIELESGAAKASAASVGDYDDRELAVVAAQIAGVEATHWAALLGATGENPVPNSFIPPAS